jgi:hypothetical protein
MLALTRPHRQVAATLALAVFTVVPTVYVSFQVWRSRRPEHVREIERELGHMLGLRVSIQSVRHPRPGEDVLTGVVLRPEGAGDPAAAVSTEWLHVRREGHDLTLEAHGLKVAGDAPSLVLAQASGLFAKAESTKFKTVSFAADGCDLALGKDLHYRISAIAGRLSIPAPSGAPILTASCQIPADGLPTRCELALFRERTETGSHSAIAFKTMEGPPLSARVLDPFFASADWLGATSHVDGSLALRQVGSSGWEATFEGNLYDVNLATLTDRQFPDHRLRGLGRLRVDSARWGELPGGKQGFGWLEARGSLTAGQGSISSSLLAALATDLKFRLPKRHDTSALDVEFHNLGLRFALSPQGEIRFDGDLGPEFAPGAILARGDRTAPLASAPDGAASVVGLRKALVPVTSSEMLVPARAESEFMRHLPLPSGGAPGTLKAN